MTEPARLPHPAPIPADWQSLPTWCRKCEIHQATNHRPLCPSCLDDEARAIRGEAS